MAVFALGLLSRSGHKLNCPEFIRHYCKILTYLEPLCIFKRSKSNFANPQSWQEVSSFKRQAVPEKSHKEKWVEGDQGITDEYRKFQEEEMALLTDDPSSVHILEAILKCPMKLRDWNNITKMDHSLLGKMSSVIGAGKQPSVTKILQETVSPMNKFILQKWKKKKIDEMGEEGFNEYMRTLTNEGKEFHKGIEHFFGQESVNISELGQWKSILPLLEKVSMVDCIESNTAHPLLSYQGRIDCVATYENMLCLFDWKLSTARKDSLKKCYDDPYQVAAYAGAFNICNSESKQVSNAVIVKAYRDGTPANVHFLNEFVLEFYWEAWLRRLARHHMQIFNSTASQR